VSVTKRDIIVAVIGAVVSLALTLGGLGLTGNLGRVEYVEVPVEVEKVVEVEAALVVGSHGGPTWEPPDLSGREYVIWGLEYDPHIDAYRRLAERFKEFTGAEYTIEPQGWPIEDKIITGMAAGIVPDVVCIMGRQIAGLVYEDALVDLTDEVYGSVPDDWFSPVSRGAYSFDGKVYGIPTEGNCVSGVTNIRLDLLREAGLEHLWPPNQGKLGFDSFDDMYELAEGLQDAGVAEWGMSSQGWDAGHLWGIMLTLGQPFWDEETRTFHMDSPEALEAMNLLAYRPIFELGIETQADMKHQELLNAGVVALSNGNVTGPSSGKELGLEIDTCLYPSAVPGEEAKYMGEGGWGFVVPSQAENPDIGIEFMKFLSTYEGNREYCRIYGGIVSAVNAVNSDDELFPEGTLVGDAMRRAAVGQARTEYYGGSYGTPGEAASIVGSAVEAVRVGEMTPEEALAEAQAGLEEMLARWDAEH
jgi:ABC-type glycerol-3-phosphate transport system substrate-binding protein